MENNPFTKRTDAIVKTLSEIFSAQKNQDYVKILDASSPIIEEMEYDNWNGGTYYYALYLEVPVEVFAEIESKLTKHEQEIESKLQLVFRGTDNYILNRVIIRPQLIDKTLRDISKDENKRTPDIWKDNFIRIFVSHQHKDKAEAAKLKQFLYVFNISVFVAHEDIEPTIEWLSEIKIALNTMEACVVLLTPNFRDSKWTDQEVGFAVAKRVPIIHVRDGQDPYGFIGETQSLSLSIDKHETLGISIICILLRNLILKDKMRETLFVALENTPRFSIACKIMKLLEDLGNITEEETERIRKAYSNNSNVKKAFSVQTFLENNTQSDEIPF